MSHLGRKNVVKRVRNSRTYIGNDTGREERGIRGGGELYHRRNISEG